MMEALACHPLGVYATTNTRSSSDSFRYYKGPNATIKKSTSTRGTDHGLNNFVFLN